MRLIDADALKEHAGYYQSVTVQSIDAAPTVDAIPVEWLCGKIREEEKFGGIPFGRYLKELIWEWHQEDGEQEASADGDE